MWPLPSPLFLSVTPSLRLHPLPGVSFELAESKLVLLPAFPVLFLFFSYICSLFTLTSFSVSSFLFLCCMSLVGKKNEGRTPSRRSVIIPASSGDEFHSLFQKKQICGLISFSLEVHSYVFVRRGVLKADWAM